MTAAAKMMWTFLMVVTLAISACDRSTQSAGGSDEEEDEQPTVQTDEKLTAPDGRVITRGKEIQPPDLTAAAKTPQFQAAIKRAAELTQRQPKPLEIVNDESDQPPGGVAFDVPHNTVEASLEKWRKELLAQGAYLVRSDNSFGIGGAGAEDKLALLPTTDKYAVLATMQTNGANYDLMPGDIIDWLKGMEKTQPWELTEAGYDYLAGRFTTPLKNAKTLAKQMYDFCPDIVDQGTGDVEKLESELGKGALYFWWD